jgi:Zn-dependent peptidase ImmA (M78 family)
MGMCDKIDNWEHMTPDNKVDAVQDLVAHMAEDYDVPVPQVVSGIPDFPQTPEDDSQKSAAYDPETNTLYINENIIAEHDANHALDEAAHEFGHELFDQNFRDENTQPGESEDYADAYKEQLRDEIDDYCDNPPPPQSPGDPDEGLGDWNVPADEGTTYA